MPRVFIGGILVGHNYPSTDKPILLDADKCSDLITVDRKYFINNSEVIYSWALSFEKRESAIEKATV